MIYHKVNPRYDGVRIGKRTLIANELYTANELKKYNIPAAYTSILDISRRNIFISFGARFECEN